MYAIGSGERLDLVTDRFDRKKGIVPEPVLLTLKKGRKRFKSMIADPKSNRNERRWYAWGRASIFPFAERMETRAASSIIRTGRFAW